MRRSLSSTALAVFVCAWTSLAALQSSRIDATALLADLRALSADDMEGRRVGTTGSARARGVLVRRFLEVGLQPLSETFEQPFRAGAVAGVNVVGYLPGRERPDEYIVVSAHYDHLGVVAGETFNGANDNASGTAALPAIAAAFAARRPATSLIFAAFDAEETGGGLFGSRAFVARPPVPREAMLVNLNMDMIGRDPSNTLWVVGTRDQPLLRPVVERAAIGLPVVLRMGYDGPSRGGRNDWRRDSDQWAFIEQGIPALYFGVEDFALHHSPDDDFERMTLDFYVRAVESMLRIIEVFDREASASWRSSLRPAA